MLTALSYAEVAARVPTAGGPIDYTEEAFGWRWFSSGIGWALCFAQIVSGATIATGFASYLGEFVDIPHNLVVVGLVAIVGAVDPARVAGAKAPLVEAVKAVGWDGRVIGYASLFIIVNGALSQVITGARLLLDLGRDERGAPAFFGYVSERTRTPVRATVAVSSVLLGLALFVPLKALATLTSFVILVVFTAVNASLVQLKRSTQPDDVPNLPISVPIAGTVVCGLLLVAQLVKTVGGL